VKSYREIFRSSAIIGGSSALSIAIGIVRVKVVAVLLGPSGIGLLGIYQNIIGVASTVAGCGMNNSGVRQLAASHDDAEVLTAVRRALLLANILLGLVGMGAVWLLREPIATWVFDGAIAAGDVGWLGLGVLMSLVATSQTTLLQGLRRIGDLARVTVISALISSAVGIAIVYALGEAGLVWFVIVSPAIAAVIAAHFTRRLTPPSADYDWPRIQKQCQAMIGFGVPVMLAGLLNIGTELFVRSLVIRELGIDASGHFQASWVISMTYLGFVLGAMGADYYPRLTAVYPTPEKARQLVNEQAEMALLLAGAVILAMITLAPLVMVALYSSSFEPAAELLRWQMLGSFVKLIGWPMGFVVLASGRSGLFVYTQFVWNAVFVLCLYLLLERFGLLAVGIAFCIAYAVSVLNVWFVANRLIGMMPTRFNVVLVAFLIASGSVIIYLAESSPGQSVLVGAIITAAVAVYSFRKITLLLNARDWLRSKRR
jgi:O-antigen/teichoic acid export membrane protein